MGEPVDIIVDVIKDLTDEKLILAKKLIDQELHRRVWNTVMNDIPATSEELEKYIKDNDLIKIKS